MDSVDEVVVMFSAGFGLAVGCGDSAIFLTIITWLCGSKCWKFP